MKLKTLLLTGLMLLLTAGIIFAATPSQIITDLTGLTDEQLTEMHLAGKTYGQIAEENGVLDAYQEAMLQEKIALINARVSDGTFTSEQASAYITKLTENQAVCDPSNPDRIMQGSGLRFGNGGGAGFGRGAGLGNGVNCLTPGTNTGLGGFGRANGMGFGRVQTNN